jgi:hypothetical protein
VASLNISKLLNVGHMYANIPMSIIDRYYIKFLLILGIYRVPRTQEVQSRNTNYYAVLWNPVFLHFILIRRQVTFFDKGPQQLFRAALRVLRAHIIISDTLHNPLFFYFLYAIWKCIRDRIS